MSLLDSGEEPIATDSGAPKNKKKNTQLKSDIETCKTYRRKLSSNWSTSIDYRRGKPFLSQVDSDSIAVNLDWSYSKTKIAELFSQLPQVRVSHPPQSAAAGPWLAAYESLLNDNLRAGGIEAVMEEVLPDCINAAGIGVALACYESITVDKEVPTIDIKLLPPELQAEAAATKTINGLPIPTKTVPQITDRRYVVHRISPVDFLWPIEFTGSNFDLAPWIGRSGRVTWAEAVQRFELTEEDKSNVLGEDRTHMDQLTHDVDKEHGNTTRMVAFDEIFYYEHKYDPTNSSFSTIHHVVFVKGKDEPVIDEPWKGQIFDPETNVLIGAAKYPIRVLTLAYITDDPIPPSDSAIGRSQVDEINKSRSQVLRQRDRNIPVRWFDVNRVDPMIQQALMRGTWQHMIPVQGEGSRIIGEVAKSNHPQDNMQFDTIAKNDLSEAWSIGPNQLGSGAAVETKGEAAEISTHFQTRQGKERARVAAFFVGIAEVIGSLMCVFEDPSKFGEGFNPEFSRQLQFSVLADSTLLVDANQRLQRIDDFLNKYAKSGFVALEPVLREIAILSGLDPNTVIKAPDPKPPMEPNISLRLTGGEDMTNPLLLAFMLQSGQAPSPELIEQAKQLIQLAVLPKPVNAPPTPGSAMDNPEPPPPAVGEANPDLTIMPKITKRSDDPSGAL